MDTLSLLLSSTPLSLTTIHIIESYLNTIFVLDQCGIYMFDGKKVETYKCLSSTYSDLVYTSSLGLCFKDREDIKYIDKEGNIQNIVFTDNTYKSLYMARIKLLGGDDLKYEMVGRIYHITPSLNECTTLHLNECTISSQEAFTVNVSVIHSLPPYVVCIGGYRMSKEKRKIAKTLLYNLDTHITVTGESMIEEKNNFASVVWNNYIYVFGGIVAAAFSSNFNIASHIKQRSYDANTLSNRVQRYNCTTKKWIQCKAMPIPAKNICAVIIGNCIYILGCDPSLCYNPIEDSWKIEEDFIFNPYCSATSV